MKGSTILQAASVITVDAPENPGSHSTQLHLKTRLDLDARFGFFTMDSMFARNFGLHHVELNFAHDTLMKASTDSKPKYGLAFMFKGAEVATFGDKRFEVNGGKSVFTFNPSIAETHCFLADRAAKVSYFEIDAAYFDGLLFDNVFEENHCLREMKCSIERNEFAELATSMGIAQAKIISDINNCPLQGNLGNMMLEGSLQQLIALQFASSATSAKAKSLCARDEEVIYAIKEYLNGNFEKDHSLFSLSRKFGINQGKLKKNFKQVVGVPVIEFIYNLKMDHARRLLLDGGLNVGQVAPIVGYRHAHHFTAAFKRKYGMNPSQLRT